MHFKNSIKFHFWDPQLHQSIKARGKRWRWAVAPVTGGGIGVTGDGIGVTGGGIGVTGDDIGIFIISLAISVLDPYHFDADPDPT